MTKHFARKFFLILALLSISSFAKAEETKADVTGMYFYATWCSACKTLEPKLEESKALLSDSSFELVKFDVSNKPKEHQSKLLAEERNLGSKFDEIGVKTGFVVLIDTKTGKEIGRINRSDSPEKIANKVKKAEAATRS